MPKAKSGLMKVFHGYAIIDKYNEIASWQPVFNNITEARERRAALGTYPHIGPLRIARVEVREVPKRKKP